MTPTPKANWAAAGRTCLALLAVALLVGCGASEEAPEVSPTTTTPTSPAPVGGDVAERQEFIAEGDAICADGQFDAAELKRRADEIQAQRGTLSDEELLDRAADLWDDQIALIRSARDQFTDLDPPEGDEARIDELIDSFDEGVEAAGDIKAALDDDEDPSVELVQAYARIVARGNTLAQAYGFRVCGRIS